MAIQKREYRGIWNSIFTITSHNTYAKYIEEKGARGMKFEGKVVSPFPCIHISLLSHVLLLTKSIFQT